MSSIRWEMMREGLEDYEYLWLLETRTKEVLSRLGVDAGRFPSNAVSSEICGRLVRSLTDYVTDSDAFYQVRRELAQEIVGIEQSPLVLLAADPPPNKALDTGPAVTKLYGFVEEGAEIKINGSEVFVNPRDGGFQKKVSLTWSQPVVTIEVKLNDKMKVFKKRFSIQ